MTTTITIMVIIAIIKTIAIMGTLVNLAIRITSTRFNGHINNSNHN